MQVPESISVIRKKKEKVIAVGEYLLDGPHVEGNIIKFTLVAKNSGSLRPDLLLSECLKLSGSDARISNITRVDQREQ